MGTSVIVSIIIIKEKNERKTNASENEISQKQIVSVNS